MNIYLLFSKAQIPLLQPSFSKKVADQVLDQLAVMELGTNLVNRMLLLWTHTVGHKNVPLLFLLLH